MSELLNKIPDEELRILAKNLSLDEWDWQGAESYEKILMIIGAASFARGMLQGDVPGLVSGHKNIKTSSNLTLVWGGFQVEFDLETTDEHGVCLSTNIDFAEMTVIKDERVESYFDLQSK